MNNGTADSGGFVSSSNFGVSLGILILITTILLASYYCSTRSTGQPSTPPRQAEEEEEAVVAVLDIGLDQETITSYPKLLYSEAKLEKSDSSGCCCSISVDVGHELGRTTLNLGVHFLLSYLLLCFAFFIPLVAAP